MQAPDFPGYHMPHARVRGRGEEAVRGALAGNTEEQVSKAADFLKALANPSRLMILCLLDGRELSVGELEEELGLRQPTLSQQLARLREEGLVDTRRSGKQIFYSLASEEVRRTIALLHEMFCEEQAEAGAGDARTGRGEGREERPVAAPAD